MSETIWDLGNLITDRGVEDGQASRIRITDSGFDTNMLILLVDRDDLLKKCQVSIKCAKRKMTTI